MFYWILAQFLCFHPFRTLKAFIAFMNGLDYEGMSRREEARREFETAAEYYHQLHRPSLEALSLIHIARADRDNGNIQRALDLIIKVETLRPLIQPPPVRLYVEIQHQNTWGTICQKQRTAAAQHEARLHFERAIEACKTLLSVLPRAPSTLRSLGPLLPREPWSLVFEIERDKALNQINVAETRKMIDPEAAVNIAADVLRFGKEHRDSRLQASGHRILGEVAHLRARKFLGAHGPDEQWWREMEVAQDHFKRALVLYRRSEASTPQVVAATENELLFIQLSVSFEQWIRDGRPDKYPAAKRVPEHIVFLDHPWLRNVDKSAKDRPVEARWHNYFLAALRWDDAGWFDRSFQYLVSATECLIHLRENLPLVGSFVSEQRAHLIAEGKQIFDMLMQYLLSPHVRPHLRVSDPEVEAFRYREIFGPTGLLDELELAGTVSEAASQHPDGELLLKGDQLIAGTACDAKAVQRALSSKTVLIEYVVTNKVLTAFVVTDTELAAIPLPVTTAELRERTQEFLEAVGHEKSQISGRITKSGLPQEPCLDVIKEEAQWLYEVLLRPVEQIWRTPKDRPVDRIIIIPYDILHQLPFCALFDGSQFVCEVVPVTQCPSASIFKALCERRSDSKPPVTYFGFANPRGQSSAWALTDIPGCERAVLSVANQFVPDCRWEDDKIIHGEQLCALRRQMASSKSFFYSAPHYQIVDLQTHGGWSEPLGRQTAKWASHGFLAVGESGQPEWVTARELILHGRGMNAELLIAGICEGGSFEMPLGDEIAGLLRAFLMAGCRTILVYPWLLVDTIAETFMRDLYECLLKRDGHGRTHFCANKDVALQKAQICCIEAGRGGKRHINAAGISASVEHPYYWAWTLVGDYASSVCML